MDEEKMGKVSSGERPQRNRLGEGRKGRCREVVKVEEAGEGNKSGGGETQARWREKKWDEGNERGVRKTKPKWKRKW